MGTFAVTIERGTDGTYLGWVDDLPGCAARAPTRAELLERLPDEIAEFCAWAGDPVDGRPTIAVTEELESHVETDEDTEAFVTADRRPLTTDDLARLLPWLARSRVEVLEVLTRVDLEAEGENGGRTAREELEHVGFVELMYAMWTFDLHSRDGLVEFLEWARQAAIARLRELGRRGSADVTWAAWAGAPRPEPWTARKAARRLLWHELLHLRKLRDGA